MSDPTQNARHGIRFRLLLSINAVAALGLAVFVFLDYRQEVRSDVVVMRGALEEEAKTMLPAVRWLAATDHAAVQRYVDLVCARMRESTSPGHHIAVLWDGSSIQARAHDHDSHDMLAAMQQALSQGGLGTGHDGIVVGSDTDGQMTVYVSERVSHIVERARARAIQRAAVLIGLVIVGALVVNLVLLYLVVRPVRALATTVRRVAAGRLGARAPDSKTAELSILASEINNMSSALLNIEHLRQQEMYKAQEIQERLCHIPDEIPGVTVARLYRPAAEVAGDYYDVLPLPDGTWLFCVADVIGHGIPAAMTAAILKTLLASAAERVVAPGQLLDFVNERLCRVSLPGDFATMALVRWDPEHARLEYAGAGHEPGLLRRPDTSVSLLESTGAVLGILEDAAWETRSLAVAPGTQLLFATDGVTETLSPDGVLFGSDRLLSLFAENGDLSPAIALHRIEESLETHRGGGDQTDDITLLLAQFGVVER